MSENKENDHSILNETVQDGQQETVSEIKNTDMIVLENKAFNGSFLEKLNALSLPHLDVFKPFDFPFYFELYKKLPDWLKNNFFLAVGEETIGDKLKFYKWLNLKITLPVGQEHDFHLNQLLIKNESQFKTKITNQFYENGWSTEALTDSVFYQEHTNYVVRKLKFILSLLNMDYKYQHHIDKGSRIAFHEAHDFFKANKKDGSALRTGKSILKDDFMTLKENGVFERSIYDVLPFNLMWNHHYHYLMEEVFGLFEHIIENKKGIYQNPKQKRFISALNCFYEAYAFYYCRQIKKMLQEKEKALKLKDLYTVYEKERSWILLSLEYDFYSKEELEAFFIEFEAQQKDCLNQIEKYKNEINKCLQEIDKIINHIDFILYDKENLKENEVESLKEKHTKYKEIKQALVRKKQILKSHKGQDWVNAFLMTMINNVNKENDTPIDFKTSIQIANKMNLQDIEEFIAIQEYQKQIDELFVGL